jgi:FkbM family methyltransferase
VAAAENKLDVLAFADELSADPSLLSAWNDVFTGRDRVTLLIHPGALEPEEVPDRLAHALGASGVGVDTDLDLEAFPGPLTDIEQESLVRRCMYALTQRALGPPFASLSAVGADTVATLRKRLPIPQAQSNRVPAARQTLESPYGPFHVRLIGADVAVVQGVFNDQTYQVEPHIEWWPGLEAYTNVSSPNAVQHSLIIDAGANIGGSAVYLASKYPDATVVALEPERNNYELLVENTARFANVIPLNKAIGGQPGTLPLTDPGHGSASFRVGRDVAQGQVLAEVEVVTVAQIVAQHPDAQPFLLKVDIEGGEKELFDGDLDAVSSFPVVVVELHDRIFSGQGVAGPFLRWHLSQPRDIHQVGENTWSFASSLSAR